MLFALLALCFLLVNVGAQSEGCLTHHPLSSTYIQFNVFLNANLDIRNWDNDLARRACDQAREGGVSDFHQYKGERTFKRGSSASLTSRVNSALRAGLSNSYQKNLVRNFNPDTKYGCNTYQKGDFMRAVCLYETQ